MNEKLSIVIVDDNRTNLALMDMLARKLPNCETQLFTEPQAFLNRLDGIDFDVAVFDCHMPGVSGIELARSVRAQSRLAAKPIVIVTADQDTATRENALEAGATDVLHRPIKPVEFKMRLSALARPAESQRPLRGITTGAAGDSIPRTGETGSLRSVEEDLVSAFARAAGYKDRETPLHATRMACYCAIIAHHLGLSDEACAELRLAAPLHDIGKVGLRDDVLQNRGFLSEEQRRHMAEHTLMGHAILSAGRSKILMLAAEIALTHHERWDGAGYPRGLKGEEIPLAGRIAAVADVFDALTSLRPYKRAWSMNNAFTYLYENAGEQFDPNCVAAFQIGREEVEAVMTLMPDLHAGPDADAA
jgi:putative two-component system response regulator